VRQRKSEQREAGGEDAGEGKKENLSRRRRELRMGQNKTEFTDVSQEATSIKVNGKRAYKSNGYV